MAKNFKLIPGENNNWEVATLLLIDHLFIPNPQSSHLEFIRADLHSSMKALNFIENLLGPIGYEVNKTLSNSISSAITRLEQKGYLECEDGECILTENGFKRLQEIRDKYALSSKEAIGKNKELIEIIKNSDPEEIKKILKRLEE